MLHTVFFNQDQCEYQNVKETFFRLSYFVVYIIKMIDIFGSRYRGVQCFFFLHLEFIINKKNMFVDFLHVLMIACNNLCDGQIVCFWWYIYCILLKSRLFSFLNYIRLDWGKKFSSSTYTANYLRYSSHILCTAR